MSKYRIAEMRDGSFLVEKEEADIFHGNLYFRAIQESRKPTLPEAVEEARRYIERDDLYSKAWDVIRTHEVP